MGKGGEVLGMVFEEPKHFLTKKVEKELYEMTL
jgi:hypothetical protein